MSIKNSVIIYLLAIISSSYALHYRNKTKNKGIMNLCMFLAIGVPVLIAGIRYSIGEDYFTYIGAFEKIKLGETVRWNGLEKGYVFLNLIPAKLGLSPQSIMFVTSFLTIYFSFKALLNKRDNISVGFGALAFMLLFYQSSFNIIRLMIAVSIFLYNIKNIEKQNLLKYLFFAVLASSVHISALITIPLYWLYNSDIFEKSFLTRFFIYACTILLIVYFNQILGWILIKVNLKNINYYMQYIGTSDKSIDIAIKKGVLYLPILLPGIIMNKKLKQQDEKFYIYYSLTLIGVMITVFSTFKAAYIDRLSQYFLIASVIVLGEYMKIFKKDKNYFACLLIICYMIFYWGYVYFIVKNHGTVPYQWIL